MTVRLTNFIAAMLAVLAVTCLGQAFGGMVAVDDEELAEVVARTGINIEGSLKATAGNLIISGTAGSLKLGGWHLNNTDPTIDGVDDPTTDSDASYSEWGPFSLDVAHTTLGGRPRTVLRLGLEDSGITNNPTWIFKNIQMKGPSDTSWTDIGGLYLQQIHLQESYINLFNDGAGSKSQIQAFGQFRGTVGRVTINWGTAFGTSSNRYISIQNLHLCGTIDGTGPTGSASGFLELGGASGANPFVWDSTSTFDGTDFNTRLWFPINGSIYWEQFTIRNGTTTDRNLGVLMIDGWHGEITVDLPQKLNPTTDPTDKWWNY